MWYEYKPHQNIFCIGFVKSQHICNHTPIYHKCKSNTSANTNWQPANTKVPMQNTKIATCKYKNTNAKYKPHQSVLCSGLVKSQHIGNRTPRPLRAPPPSPMKIILIYMIIIVVFNMIVFKNTTHSFFPNPELLGILLCKMGPEFRISICIKANNQFKP